MPNTTGCVGRSVSGAIRLIRTLVAESASSLPPQHKAPLLAPAPVPTPAHAFFPLLGGASTRRADSLTRQCCAGHTATASSSIMTTARPAPEPITRSVTTNATSSASRELLPCSVPPPLRTSTSVSPWQATCNERGGRTSVRLRMAMRGDSSLRTVYVSGGTESPAPCAICTRNSTARKVERADMARKWRATGQITRRWSPTQARPYPPARARSRLEFEPRAAWPA